MLPKILPLFVAECGCVVSVTRFVVVLFMPSPLLHDFQGQKIFFRSKVFSFLYMVL